MSFNSKNLGSVMKKSSAMKKKPKSSRNPRFSFRDIVESIPD